MATSSSGKRQGKTGDAPSLVAAVKKRTVDSGTFTLIDNVCRRAMQADARAPSHVPFPSRW
jgi:hypothetical protein